MQEEAARARKTARADLVHDKGIEQFEVRDNRKRRQIEIVRTARWRGRSHAAIPPSTLCGFWLTMATPN